jgi:hypothetical protein
MLADRDCSIRVLPGEGRDSEVTDAARLVLETDSFVEVAALKEGFPHLNKLRTQLCRWDHVHRVRRSTGRKSLRKNDAGMRPLER